jgi:O-antigen/teichoic acid export membrane protein
VIPGEYPGVRSIARNTSTLAATQFVNIATRAAYVVLVARWLGPELYALLAYTQAWYLAFLPLAMYGRGIVVHELARDPGRAPELVARVLGLRLWCTVLACLACIGVAWLVPGSAEVSGLIGIALLALAGRSLSMLAQDVYRAFEMTGYTLRQESLFRLLELATAVVVLLAGGGLQLLVAVHGLFWWLQALRSWGVLKGLVRPLRIEWRPAAWRDLAAGARPFLLLALAAAWLQDGPLVLFRQLADNDVLYAQFALAMQLVMIPAGLAQALAAAAQPVLTRSAQRADGKDLVYAASITGLALPGGALAGLLGWLLGPWFFTTVFGDRYATAGELVGPALFCLVPMVAAVGVPPVLMSRGRFLAGALAALAGALAMTLAMVWLAPRFGALGAIGAVGMGYGALCLVAWLAAWRTLRPAR